MGKPYFSIVELSSPTLDARRGSILLCTKGSGEQSREEGKTFWSSIEPKNELFKLRVSGLVKLRVCVGREILGREGLVTGTGDLLTRLAGDSMVWSWERILGSKTGPCWRIGGGGECSGVVTRVQTESEGDVSADEYMESNEPVRACPEL